MKKHCFTLLASLILTLGTCVSGQAATTFENLVVFGDSLSDTGNIGRFSDGSIWVETLAENLGASLYDYAYAGSSTGYDNPCVGLSYTGLLWQVDEYGSSSPTENSLVTVWAGTNDLVNFRSYADAVDNIETALESLYDEGFRYFMVPNLPDVTSTPKMQDLEEAVAQAESLWCQSFNDELADMLADFAENYEGVVLYDLDIYAVFDEYEVNSEEWEDLFWIDGYHPSSTGHELFATVATSALTSSTTNAVPVPGTGFLLASGLFWLAMAQRKQKNTADYAGQQ